MVPMEDDEKNLARQRKVTGKCLYILSKDEDMKCGERVRTMHASMRNWGVLVRVGLLSIKMHEKVIQTDRTWRYTAEQEVNIRRRNRSWKWPGWYLQNGVCVNWRYWFEIDCGPRPRSVTEDENEWVCPWVCCYTSSDSFIRHTYLVGPPRS